MENRNKHCALDEYFTSMFTVPTNVSVESEFETSTLATVTALRSDATSSEAADVILASAIAADGLAATNIDRDNTALDKIAPAAIPKVAYMETMSSAQVLARPTTFAMPEPDESGTLKDLDQLLESVIDIELDNIDLSILDEEEAVAVHHRGAQLSEVQVLEEVQILAEVEDMEQPIADLQPEITTTLTAVVPTTDRHHLQEDEVTPVADTVSEVVWQNVDLDEEFQALFFEVAGVTFAVPLTELGGIHQTENISALFGKPDWFLGIMQYRDLKLSVVDTAKWVMPEQDMGVIDYKYLVQLNESNWVLGCETLLGTETLNRNDVKWRTTPGSRPWLAGMVKSRMCVLLHVTEMTKLLNNGINIHGQ
ncbi:MAG: purine-binding chemotaxis protein CheW [Moritella sp.]|jgi:purine-binding chemotaxis protein CheW